MKRRIVLVARNVHRYVSTFKERGDLLLVAIENSEQQLLRVVHAKKCRNCGKVRHFHDPSAMESEEMMVEDKLEVGMGELDQIFEGICCCEMLKM